MFDWIQDIIEWFRELFNPITKLDHFVTKQNEIRGYGLSNGWINLSHSETVKFAEAMAKAGVNITHCELLSFSEDGYYTNTDDAIDKFILFAREFLKRRIAIWLTIVNFNHKTICEPQYGTAWYVRMVNRIDDELGIEGIVLESCSEWGPKCRNKSCWQKAEKWHNWTAGSWEGWMLGYNKSARPRRAPAGHIIDYHAGNDNDIGARNSVVITDHTRLLQQLGGWLSPHFDTAKTVAYMQKVRKAGNGCIIYHFSAGAIGGKDKKPDYPLIRAIGQMLKEIT